MARVIVTGGAGFIGSHLVDALIKRGDSVLVIDNLSTGKRKNINPEAEFVKCDIRDGRTLKAKLGRRKCDYLFHCAALPRVRYSFKNPKETHDVNVGGTLNIIGLAVRMEVRRLIYSSSSSIYGNQPQMPLKEDMFVYPLSPYASQKFFAEQYCHFCCGPDQDNRLNGAVCLRYFNVYGSRQSDEGDYASVIGRFLKARKTYTAGQIYGDGEQKRDFTHVGDVVRANILAMKSSSIGFGEVINVCNGKSHSVNQVSRMIGGSYERKPPQPGDIRESLGDNAKAHRLLGWEPTVTLESGIAELRKINGLD